MTIFDELDKFVNEEVYTKVLTYSSVSAPSTGSNVDSFSVPSGYVALIHEIDADNTQDAEINLLVEGQTLGAKYGLPFKTKAIPTGGFKSNIKVDSGNTVTITARGIGADVTLSFLRITILFVRKG